MIGRSLLYPPGDDVAAAVDARGGAAVSRASTPCIVRAGRAGRRAPFALVDHARDGRLGLQRRCGSSSWRRAAAPRSTPARTRPSCCRCRGRLHGDLRRRRSSRSTGRRSVFTRVTDFAYVPRDAEVTVSSARRRPVRPARRPRDPAAAAALRPGRGRAGRAARRRARPAGRSTTSARPATFEADKLIAVEVLTPGGNWSSYPPHKHDEDRDGRVACWRRSTTSRSTTAGGPGYQRVPARLRPPGPRRSTCCAEVRSGDVVLVPHGWHGPSMAAPGYDLYYLNVMAGPGDERAWLICDDPAHAWVRGTWDGPGDRPPAAPRPRPRSERARDGSPSPRRSCASWPTSTASATASSSALIPGCFGIFGHGNVAGVGQALLRGAPTRGETALPPGPQRAGHGARRRRLRPDAQPAAGAGVHRLDRPRLDQHAHRRGAGHHQPHPGAAAARPTSSPPASPAPCCRSWSSPTATTCPSTTRSARCRGSSTGSGGPSSCPPPLLGAMRVLTDPAETGAVTIALPQDVQAEAYDWPEELFAKRVWHVARPVPEPAALERAAAVIRGARRPLIVAGGGVHLLRGDRGAAARSPRPPASRSPTPRPARARCRGTTRRPSAGSAPPARRSPTRSPARPTS